uniref:Progesterone receptor n=1 Tax=Canis lupus familiaris TaxID=9615 RepID=A0A8C0SF24_CANLF
MTERTGKDARAPHVAGGAPSPAPAAEPESRRRDGGRLRASQTSDAPRVAAAAAAAAAAASAAPSAPSDRLLFSRRGQGADPGGKAQDAQPRPDVARADPRLEAASGAGADSPGPPRQDRGPLHGAPSTALRPAGPGQGRSSPAWEPRSPRCPSGPEPPEDPRGARSSQGAACPLMSRPEGKAGDGCGTAGAHKGPPRGLSPSRQPLPLCPGAHAWPGAAGKAATQPAALGVEDEGGFAAEGSPGPLLKGKPRPPAGPAAAAGAAPAAPGTAPGGTAPVPKEDSRLPAPKGSLAEQDAPAPGCSPLATTMMDFIHVPILPLGSAFLAARTRQLLEAETYDAGAFAPPRGSPSAPCAPLAAGDFPDCAYPSDAEPKDDAFPLYGDFQPPALKIKEEEEGAEAAARSPRPYLAAGPHSCVFADAPPALPALPPLPPRAPSSRPGEGAPAAAAAAGCSASSASSPGPALECVLYKAEGAPPPQGPFAAAPCRVPGAGACLLPRDGAAAAASAGAAGASPALYQPLGLGALPQLGYQAAVLKEGLPQVYQPYLNYLRPDSDASQSPQYSFESLPQKICLICGDEASGCHYGVLTCGSCKVFFKRAMEGRKFKKFNKVRVMRTLDAVALPQPVGIPNESQALSQRISFSPSQDIQLIPPLINLLMSIEPDVIYAGHDNTKPDTSSSLLTSLNQLGERQLLSVVKWSKSLPGFRNLHIDDQITLIQYSWMSLMVFGLGWRSYKHVSGQMLYFAPDLILNEQRMKESSFYSLCLTMWQIPQEFVKLQVSQEEFLCMKVLLLLNTIPLEGLRSQNQFEEMRSSYIRELIKAIGLRQKGVVSSSQRFYQLTKLLDNLHDLVKQLHLYCLNTFIQSRALSVEFPEMMSEVIAAQLPKILAGMVKPLLFHKK